MSSKSYPVAAIEHALISGKIQWNPLYLIGREPLFQGLGCFQRNGILRGVLATGVSLEKRVLLYEPRWITFINYTWHFIIGLYTHYKIQRWTCGGRSTRPVVQWYNGIGNQSTGSQERHQTNLKGTKQYGTCLSGRLLQHYTSTSKTSVTPVTAEVNLPLVQLHHPTGWG